MILVQLELQFVPPLVTYVVNSGRVFVAHGRSDWKTHDWKAWRKNIHALGNENGQPSLQKSYIRSLWQLFHLVWRQYQLRSGFIHRCKNREKLTCSDI